MYHRLSHRQTPELDACPFVSWGDYNWVSPVQCNFDHTGLKIPWNPAVYCLITALQAVTIYIALQTMIQTLWRFHSWRTLYFWALIAVCVGIILGMTGHQMQMFYMKPGTKALSAFNLPANILIRTGFVLVLYARLRILLPGHTIWHSRRLSIMIIAIAFIKHVPDAATMFYSWNHAGTAGWALYNKTKWLDFITWTENVFLSGLYIYYFRRFVQDMGENVQIKLHSHARATFYWLVFAFVITTAYETTTLTLMATGQFLTRNIVDGPACALKLVIEIFVLDQVVLLSKMRKELLQRGNLSLVLQTNPGSDSGTTAIETVEYRTRADRNGDLITSAA